MQRPSRADDSRYIRNAKLELAPGVWPNGELPAMRKLRLSQAGHANAASTRRGELSGKAIGKDRESGWWWPLLDLWGMHRGPMGFIGLTQRRTGTGDRGLVS